MCGLVVPMKRLSVAVLVSHIAAFACGLVAPACGRSAAPAEVHAAVAPAAQLTRITDARLTCMAIDRAFDEPQREAPADGRTYYACCDECRERLAAEPGLRSAVDPVSKRTVDKARAVLARDAAGALHYFESEATLAAFQRR